MRTLPAPGSAAFAIADQLERLALETAREQAPAWMLRDRRFRELLRRAAVDRGVTLAERDSAGH